MQLFSRRNLLLSTVAILFQPFLSHDSKAEAPTVGSADIPFRHILIDRDHPPYPHCKTLGDIDGDGRVDALAAGSSGEGLFWYAYPNWSKHLIDRGRFSTDMQTGDVDGDGDLDVIIPVLKTTLVWYENPLPEGDPTQKWNRHVVDPDDGGHDVEVGDLDQDGDLDIVARDGETRLFIQQPPGTAGEIVWQQTTLPTGGRGGTGLGDLDGDGDLDIAQNGYWLEMPADPQDEWPRHEFDEGWPADCGVIVYDINVDGTPDILIAPAESKGELVWYSAEDTKVGPWTKNIIDASTSFVHTFKIADVNNDGLQDIVTAEMEQSPLRLVSVYYNQGDATEWEKRVIGRTGTHNLRVADIGNDGDIDIFGANHGNHAGPTPIELWENLLVDETKPLPLDKWRRHVIDAERPWKAIFITGSDIDCDGLRDVVAGAWWYRNPGELNGEWERHVIGKPLNNMAAVFDFDKDGDPDVLGTGGTGHKPNATFVWAENNGFGEFRIHKNIDAAEGDFLQGVAVAGFSKVFHYEVALSWHHPNHGVQMFTVPKHPAAEQWTWRRISDVSQDEQLSVGHIEGRRDADLLLGTRWLRNSREGWSVHTISHQPGLPDRNRLSDMNNDGRLDAVAGFEAINTPGKLVWYEQPKSLATEWTEHRIGRNREVIGPMSLDVADVDRDGDQDVVVGEHNTAKPETARLLIFENTNGKATEWKTHIVHTGDEHHDGAILFDMDHDGDLDIISIGWTHPNMLLYENLAIDK